MDGGAWWAAVRGVAKSRARLSDFTLTFHFHTLEKEMATHSSVLAWRIPGTGEPGGLPSMGSHRVGHNWSDLAAAAAAAVNILSSSLPKIHIPYDVTETCLFLGGLAPLNQCDINSIEIMGWAFDDDRTVSTDATESIEEWFSQV